jgi:hypothetical protein
VVDHVLFIVVTVCFSILYAVSRGWYRELVSPDHDTPGRSRWYVSNDGIYVVESDDDRGEVEALEPG